MCGEEIREMIEYYRMQGAPQDQQMLISLLREAQEELGGLLSMDTLESISRAYGIRTTMLQAIIRRMPGLRLDDVPHRLEVCGTCRAGAKLRDFIERTYDVKSGGCSDAGFAYRVTPCMKNCKNGPSLRWDGQLFSRADDALVKWLVEEKGASEQIRG